MMSGVDFAAVAEHFLSSSEYGQAYLVLKLGQDVIDEEGLVAGVGGTLAGEVVSNFAAGYANRDKALKTAKWLLAAVGIPCQREVVIAPQLHLHQHDVTLERQYCSCFPRGNLHGTSSSN